MHVYQARNIARTHILYSQGRKITIIYSAPPACVSAYAHYDIYIYTRLRELDIPVAQHLAREFYYTRISYSYV